MRAHDRRSKIARGPAQSAHSSASKHASGFSRHLISPAATLTSSFFSSAQRSSTLVDSFSTRLALLTSPLFALPPNKFPPVPSSSMPASLSPSRPLALSLGLQRKIQRLPPWQQLNVHVRPRTAQTHRYVASQKLALHALVQRTHARHAL